MMEDIKSFAVCVCAIAVLGAISEGVFSQERYGKLIRLVVSAILVCVLISGIPSFDVCSDMENGYKAEIHSDELSREVADRTAQLTRDILSKTVESELAKYGYTAQKVEILVDISVDGSITINGAYITTSAGNEENIKNIAASVLAVDAESIEIYRN